MKAETLIGTIDDDRLDEFPSPELADLPRVAMQIIHEANQFPPEVEEAAKSYLIDLLKRNTPGAKH